MTSPSFMPALAAGLFGWTLSIVAGTFSSVFMVMPSTPLIGGMRRGGTLTTPKASGSSAGPAAATHWPTAGCVVVHGIDGRPIASIFSIARSYCGAMPTTRASNSRLSRSRQMILPFNSLALVTIQPSGPTTVPSAASWPLHLMRTTQRPASATTWRKAAFMSLLSRPRTSSCHASPLTSRSQLALKTSIGTCRFMSAGPPMRLLMPMMRPSRSNSGPPESPPTSVQSV